MILLNPSPLDDKGMFYDQYYNKLNFIKEIIEKYELDAFQITVLLINVDLIYSMYYEYKTKQIYNTEYPLLYTNITEKIINNLKLLVNNDFFYNLTINQLTTLQDNLIFFRDNNNVFKNYKNINNFDLIKLAFIENNLASEYISILNNLDEESKNMILDLIQPLKNSEDLFPSIIEDITFDDNGFSSKFEEIINKNKYVFENFNTFFTDNFNLDFIKQIENRQDKIYILKILLILKKTFLKKVPEKIDTRYSYITYDYETISEKDCNGCWEDVEVEVPVRVEGGILDYKEELVNNYADLIIKIKDIIMNNNDINLNEFIEANINNENRDFLTNFIYEYYIKENTNKVKRHVI